MGTAILSKGITNILAHQAVAHPNTVLGTPLDTGSMFAGIIFLYQATIVAGATTDPGEFIIMGSPVYGNNGYWVELDRFPGIVSTPDTEAMTATEPVGETDLAVADESGFASADLLYIQNSTLANSEWHTCRKTAAGHIYLINGLKNEQDNTSVIWNDCLVLPYYVNLRGFDQINVIWSSEGTAQNSHVKADFLHLNSISY